MEKKSWGFNQFYTVVYYIGGSEVGEWKVSGTFREQAEAWKMQREITQGGRPAYVYDNWQLQNQGMPVDPPIRWDFEKLKWKINPL